MAILVGIRSIPYTLDVRATFLFGPEEVKEWVAPSGLVDRGPSAMLRKEIDSGRLLRMSGGVNLGAGADSVYGAIWDEMDRALAKWRRDRGE